MATHEELIPWIVENYKVILTGLIILATSLFIYYNSSMISAIPKSNLGNELYDYELSENLEEFR